VVPRPLRREVACWIAARLLRTPKPAPESVPGQQRGEQRLGWTAEAAAALAEVLLAVVAPGVVADDEGA
jgi:hypothetical protein